MTAHPFRHPLLLTLALCGLAGCYRPPTPTRADAAIRTDCREAVERQYNAQNRVDLTRRVDRDTAFANSYNSGLTSRGLGASYYHDQMITDCLRASGDANAQPTPGVGQTFSPVGLGAPSTLTP